MKKEVVEAVKNVIEVWNSGHRIQRDVNIALTNLDKAWKEHGGADGNDLFSGPSEATVVTAAKAAVDAADAAVSTAKAAVESDADTAETAIEVADSVISSAKVSVEAATAEASKESEDK